MRTLLITAFVVSALLRIGPARADDGDDWATWTIDNGLPENEVRSVFEDRRGRLWFGTRNEGIGVFNGISWSYYRADDGLVSNGVTAFAEDSKGTIWAAGGGGYSTFDGTVWTPHDSLGVIQPRVIYSINTDWQGGLWFGANGGEVGAPARPGCTSRRPTACHTRSCTAC